MLTRMSARSNYFLPHSQILQNIQILFPQCFLQLLILFFQFHIFPIQLLHLFLHQLHPLIHRRIYNAPPGIYDSSLLFQRMIHLFSNNRILIKEPSGQPRFFHQNRNADPFLIRQHLHNRHSRPVDLLFTGLPIYLDHFVVFAHIPHPIHLNSHR